MLGRFNYLVTSYCLLFIASLVCLNNKQREKSKLYSIISEKHSIFNKKINY